MGRAACTVAVALFAICAGCAQAEPSTRSLHYVDGELVHSRPGSAASYAAYLRARMALEANPPQLEAARQHIARAIRFDHRDPHLWTTLAVIESESGDHKRALASANRALQLRPGYPPAQRLVAKLGTGPAAAAVDSARSQN